MSVYKKDGKWYFKGKIKDEYGNFKDYNRLAKKSRIGREAKKEEEEFLLHYSNKSISNSKSDLTFEQLCDLYFNEMKGSLKSSTITTNRTVLNRLDFLMKQKIKSIKTDALKFYFNKMDDENYGINYIDKFYNTINKIFKYALINNYINCNPMNNIKRIKRVDEIKKDMLFYTYEDYIWIKKASDFNNPYDAMINLLYLHGCRKGEAFALEWNDIDFDKRTIRINKTLNYKVDDAPYKITPPKTKNSIRTCKMCEELYDILIDHKNKQSKVIGFNTNRFVFGFNKPLQNTTLDRKKKDLIKKANELISKHNIKNETNIPPLQEIRIHDFRHSHASLLINSGANILAVAKRLGDTTETVMKVYAHMFLSSENELIEILDNKYKNA